MKKMTCKALGGSCDEMIEGNTAEELAENGGKHLLAMSNKDAGHKKDKEVMDRTMKNPDKMKTWLKNFKVKFNSLPAA